MKIKEFFEKYPRVGVACSGGVDSVFLLHLAVLYAKEVKAYFVKSIFQPEFELQDAKRMCESLGIKLAIIEANVLSEPFVIRNEKDRCYHCKIKIMSLIQQKLREDGLEVLLDGTNASDDATDRPGMKALQELNIISPLRICGYTKEMIRILAKEANISVWNKPSYACLATRIPTGMQITEETVQKVEKAEAYLFQKGYTDFRVRVYQQACKIQLPASQFTKFFMEYQEIRECMLKWFEDVLLDLKTR